MVLGVANYLNATNHEEIEMIKNSLSPVLLNSVASTVSHQYIIFVSNLHVMFQGNLELLQSLHREGCDLDSIDYLGRGILHVVAMTPNREEIASYLINQSINLDLLDSKARSALYLAVESDNFGVAQILAEKGASLVCDSGRLAKMLCSVGHENDLKKLRFLLDSECDIEQADYDQRTIGHLAAAEGHIQILEMLATKTQFNFDLIDRWGHSVLEELKDEETKARIIELVIQKKGKRTLAR